MNPQQESRVDQAMEAIRFLSGIALLAIVILLAQGHAVPLWVGAAVGTVFFLSQIADDPFMSAFLIVFLAFTIVPLMKVKNRISNRL